jgi:transcriptional regulator with PAS, ATPase and Fis domain
LTETLADLEKRLIQQALKQANGNKTLAAMLLKINRTTLIEKMKRLCLAA